MPVVGKTTGLVYEKELIVKEIHRQIERGEIPRCPITLKEINEDDLITVRIDKESIPRSQHSVKQMLNDLNRSYNKLLLEHHNIKKEYESSKEELSYALYRYDASCRVISKLISERDKLRDELMNLQQYNQEDPIGNSASDEIPQEILDQINLKAQELSSNRKKRSIPKDLIKLDTIQSKQPEVSFYQSDFKISAVDLKNNLLSIGGSNGNILVLGVQSFEEMYNFSPKQSSTSQRVTDIEILPGESALLGSYANASGGLWNYPNENKGKLQLGYKVTCHDQSINSVSALKLNHYAIFCSSDSYWSLHNFNQVWIQLN